MHFKQPGRDVILLGGLGECEERRFGGTQYAKAVLNSLWGLPPALVLDYEKRVQGAMREVAARGLAESAHDLSDGGLAAALAEASFGESGVGAEIRLESSLRPEFLLFHEGPSRILVSTAEAENVLGIAAQFGVEALRIGVTMRERLRIANGPETLVDCELKELKRSWETSLEHLLRQP